MIDVSTSQNDLNTNHDYNFKTHNNQIKFAEMKSRAAFADPANSPTL